MTCQEYDLLEEGLSPPLQGNKEDKIIKGNRMLMSANPAAQNENPSAAADTPVFHDAAEEAADRAILGGASVDHSFSNEVAARTETPGEAAIDAANGLRGAPGRTPRPEDFEGLLTPAGNSGDIVGTDIGTGSAFPFGDNGALGGTTPP